MPPRRRPPSDFGHEANHHENDGGEFQPPPPPPPFHDGIHPTLVQFLAETTRHFAEAVLRIPRPMERVEHLGCSIRDFSTHRFRSFAGNEGPDEAEAWLTDIGVLFDTLDCTNEQKVRYIGLNLTGEARRWWNSKMILLSRPRNEIAITWEMFQTEYNRRFFPRAQRQLWAIDFQNLVQGSMSVEQYSARFMELARFALNLIPNEESKAERFENGLNPQVKERVLCHEIKDYARLVEVASLAERWICELAEAYDMKKRSKQKALYPAKRSIMGSGFKPSTRKSFPPALRNQKNTCSKCGKMHGGDCGFVSASCFKCGKTSHYLKDCPMNPAGGVNDEEGFAEVVTGTVPLFGSLACTLFDSGATHTFISFTYVKLCGIIHP
jgi:hypothetical protein